jgi:D-sedoheptulose 7-phosphate isomerase
MIGNGGSDLWSAIFTDFINVAGLRVSTLHDSSLITCMANDYGYENVFSTSLDKIAKKDDILIAISSSGISMNVVNGVTTMKRLGGKVLTFSGFDKDNTLCQLGDLNVWLGDHQYERVEIGHLFILHHLADFLGI